MMSADASTPQRAQTPLATVSRAALIDEDGALSPRFEEVLLAIFSKYATKRDGAPDTIDSYAILPEGLDRFGRDTNGVPLPEEQLEEMRTFLDCDTEGNLLFKGFIQMYSLQTSSEEEETWRDLHSHGYNNYLQLVSSRQES